MATLEHSIMINAPADMIEAIAIDGKRAPEWVPGVLRAEPDDVHPEPGGKLYMAYKVPGVTFGFTSTIMELKRGQGLTERMDGVMSGIMRWEYIPENGGTWVKINFDYEMIGGILGKAIDRLVMKDMNRRSLEKILENLKGLVESSVYQPN
jgi:uncharacterized membrane protein